jgi:hypothetical protein
MIHLRLYLPGGGDTNVTGIRKISAPVKVVPELEAPPQSQASSPARLQFEGSEQVGTDGEENAVRLPATGEQSVEVSSDTGEQNMGEQAKESMNSKRVSTAEGTPL